MELYRGSLLSDANLKAYYRLENGAITTDSGPNGKTLSVVGTVNATTAKYGYGANFVKNLANGLTGPTQIMNNVGAFTVGLWAYPHSVPGETSGQMLLILGEGDSGLGQVNIMIRSNEIAVGGGGSIGGRNSITGSFKNLTGTNGTWGITAYTTNDFASINTWYHIVLTYDGTYLKLYVNGTLQNTQTTSGNAIDGTKILNIGRLSASWYAVDSIVDDISILDRALTADEVSTLYNIKAWTLNLTDTATSSDIFSKIYGRFRTLNDIGTLSEILQRFRTIIRFETSTLSETIIKALGLKKSLTDSTGTTTDEIDNVKARGLEFNDISILSDIISRSWSSAKNFVDNITSSDLFTKIRGYFHTLIDTHILTDSFTKSQVTNRNLNDSMSLLDSIKKYLNGFVLSRWIKKAKATLTFSKVAKPSTTWTKTEKPDDL